MIGKTLSVVTLEQEGIGLSDNYIKVELAGPREANRIVDVEIGGIGDHGLRERSGLMVL